MPISVITIAAALFLVTAAVNLEVPLYRTYAQTAGFGNGLTAIVFSAYVAGLLPVLMLLGGVSDRLGRKPVLLAGLLSATLATALMILSPNMHTLLLTRLLQGVGVGLSVGTGTAYLTEIAKIAPSRAAIYVTVTTSLGFGGGALLTSGVLLAHPTIVPVSYWIVLLLTLGCIAFVLRLPPLPPIGGASVRLPYFPPGTLTAGLAIALAWAVTGMVIAIVPTQLGQHQLTVWTGLALFLVNGTGVLVQPIARRLSAKRSLSIGFCLLPIGYGLLVLGAGQGILALVLAGAAVAGAACYGFTYLGGLAAVSQAGGVQRARAVSGYFLFAYLGFGLPTILIGFIADRLGVMTALVGFGIAMVCASAALYISIQRPKPIA